jgi:hypothetical protein
MSAFETLTARTLLRYLLGILCVVAFGAYFAFQARFLIAGPTITLLDTPRNPQSERVVTLEGKAENIVRIYLNDRQIFTDKSGYFKEALVLENGYTIATLSAEDRYGRVEKVRRAFVFVGETDTALEN